MSTFIPWTNYRIISKGDYNYAYVPEHPNATGVGYVLEHRIIMENKLGRLLTRKEVVHHLNEIKKDNRPENLELKASRSIHAIEHGLDSPKNIIKLKCPNCKIIFNREKVQSHLVKGGIFTACSLRCRGKFSSKIQYEGYTQDVKNSIKENVIEIFQVKGLEKTSTIY